jgi:tetratricopeptide (TPR) repeat protein
MHFYPLTFTSYWLEYRLWGLGTTDAAGLLRPYGYHFTNTALHITGALLLYVLLRRLKLPGGDFGAWLAAAIFALHPVNVESVVWIAERKNVLSEVFFFASLLYALRYFNITGDFDARRAPRDYGLALLLFLLAMLAKTAACVLPVAVLILLWWRQGRVTLRQSLQLGPFFALAGALGLVTVYFEQQAGALGPEFLFSWPQRIVIAGRAFWFYLGKLAWPHPILTIYPRWPYEATDVAHRLIPANPLDLLYSLAAAALFVALFLLRKKISRGPLAALLFFVIALAPALGFIPFYTQLYTFVADHYQYLAAPAAIVLAVEAALLLAARTGWKPKEGQPFTPPTIACCTVLLLPLAVITLVEGHRYADDAGLWRHTLAYNPDSFAAWNNLASCTANRGDVAGGIAAYERGVALRPDNFHAYEGLSDLYLVQGNWEKSRENEQLAIARTPPTVLATRERWRKFREQVEAERRGQEAPLNPAAVAGLRLLAQGQNDAALVQFRAALQQDPGDFRIPYYIGNVYVEKSAYDKAIEWYGRSLQLKADDAECFFNLAQVLKMLHRDADAAKALDQAQRLDPGLLLRKLRELRDATLSSTRPAATAPAR